MSIVLVANLTWFFSYGAYVEGGSVLVTWFFSLSLSSLLLLIGVVIDIKILYQRIKQKNKT